MSLKALQLQLNHPKFSLKLTFIQTLHQQQPKKKLKKFPQLYCATKVNGPTSAISCLFKTNNIKVTHARTYVDGITTQPQTSEDFRKIIKIFNSEKIEYHTYQLPSENELHVVIRGIPEPMSTSEVKIELEEKGFHPFSVTRMKSFATNTPLPLLLVTVPKDEKEIFNITNLLYLKVVVETQRKRSGFSQCHRCQKFGHAQKNCTATPKCVKCAQDHHTAECGKTKETPANCANCGKTHTASYRGCKSWPKLRQINKSSDVTESSTYSDKLNANQINKNQDLTVSQLFTNFQNMYMQMQKIAQQMSKMFVNEIKSAC